MGQDKKARTEHELAAAKARLVLKDSRAIAALCDPHGYLDELVKSAGEEARELRNAIDEYMPEEFGASGVWWALFFAARDLAKMAKIARPLLRELREKEVAKSQG